MKITLLGTGTSTGVPLPGCSCAVCLSPDPRDNRLRTSVYVELRPEESGENTGRGLLIDTSTDFRLQALRAQIRRIDAVLYTHTHSDHICGIDDLRCFNFLTGCPIPLFASAQAAADLQHRFGYCFGAGMDYEGGSPPQLVMNTIEPYTAVRLCGVDVVPLIVLHGSMPVLSYRIGSFAYVTDCSTIPEATADCLQHLDVLIIDGLRMRPHPTHFTFEQAVEAAEMLKPKRTFLTHISHEIEHKQANAWLREKSGLRIECAWDGMEVETVLQNGGGPQT